MVTNRHLSEPDGSVAEGRISERTAREVLRRAGALQNRQQGSYTLAELEAVGAEVGLQPTSIHQALAQVTVEPPAELRRERRSEFLSLLAALAVGPAWAGLAGLLWYLSNAGWNLPAEGLAPITLLILPLLVAMVQGFIARRPGAGFMAGFGLGVCLSCPFWWWVRLDGGLEQWPAWGAAGAYAVFAGFIGGGLGMAGSAMREYYFPRAAPAPRRPGETPLPAPEPTGSQDESIRQPS